MIKITVEKLLNNEQEKSFKIISIEGLRPKESFGRAYYDVDGNTTPWISAMSVSDPKGIYISADNIHNIIIGSIITERRFTDSLEYIKKAGERAHQYAQEIKKLKETWKGTETFII